MLSRKGEFFADPRDALIGSLDAGHTGCLSSRAEVGGRFRVYVMLGEVLAAHSEDDAAAVLARLPGRGILDATELADLRARVADGAPLVESLFDRLPEGAVLELLAERFRECLLGYLCSEVVESFEPLEAVFTDNIQVGHDSGELIEELVTVNARIRVLRGQQAMILAPGAVEPETDQDHHILACCANRARLSDLVERSGLEPGRALDTVHRMLNRGMLVGVVPQPRVPAKAVSVDVEDTVKYPAPPDLEPNVESDEPVTDAPTVEGLPRSSFFRGVPDVEDDLAAFQDYDTTRDGGAFVTERALLDRVDLEPEPDAAPVARRGELAASTETLIEMEDAEGKDAERTAVSLNFSGPKLHDDEIRRKIEVTNEVLATISAAIEAAEGRGSGQARLQLLVEGTSVQLAPLFKNVELGNNGHLPTAAVIKNLRKRPAGEHRRLLNRALGDLIERALSAAFESLDESALETMLEQIAGYQQRLGV